MKKIITIFMIVALLLIGSGVTYNLYTKAPIKSEETKEPTRTNSPEKKITELESITTKDYKINLGRTSVYNFDGITGMMLYITPYEDFEKVYLKITIQLKKAKEEIVLTFENLKSEVPIKHEYQTLNDWSTLKSWDVQIITEDEAQKIWTSQKK